MYEKKGRGVDKSHPGVTGFLRALEWCTWRFCSVINESMFRNSISVSVKFLILIQIHSCNIIFSQNKWLRKILLIRRIPPA